MMKAIMKEETYPDLEAGVEYTVTRMFWDYYINIEGSKRRYDGRCFRFKVGDDFVSMSKAYMEGLWWDKK